MAESLLEFPCSFPIKIMGRTEDGFAQLVLDIVLRHIPDFDSSTMEMRASREGKYLSLASSSTSYIASFRGIHRSSWFSSLDVAGHSP